MAHSLEGFAHCPRGRIRNRFGSSPDVTWRSRSPGAS
jgi:hypothetical protein